MVSFKRILSAVALILLAFYVQSSIDGGLYINLMILLAVAVYLLAFNVESPAEEEEISIYDAPVFKAERMKRPLEGTGFEIGPISHSGVRVTLANGSQWLVHKQKSHADTVVASARDMSSNGKGLVIKGKKYVNNYVNKYGDSFDTVVISAQDMSSNWTVVERKDFQGTKTVGDFVQDGGCDYNLLFNNCHRAADRMMTQKN
ncbi:uncharacterized protein LOC116051219 [Sander lucioperca]|uniref:uncharacterized protein LOC116051219 n=1 Tax=Sander lucioperca TaxID=283035 RepID=UPI00125D42B8|nr:uncharacterized protein LOC116051219 [Sander lucioperca]